MARLELEALLAGQDQSVRLKVRGLDDPPYDPRVPELIVAVRRYRAVDAVALYSTDHGRRLVAATGKPATFLAHLDQDHLDSMPLAVDTVERLVAAHGVIADLFGASAQVA